ncbi:hypothetical protein [Liquorilactobacillus nagelii]|jgi:hypothetical protein|uniref:hypothetical protein n=1 Tax=Liquorilactobacillus nagelii TaxID=82688 RepID=UPI00242E2B6B|nr:hypothetical protein [Liquorilactobacillus nagelii]MCI1699181.1 hypothetical protein [Liquorilactobacillus nagelii]
MKIRKKIIFRLLAEITICGFWLFTLAGCQKNSIYHSNTATKTTEVKDSPLQFVKSSYQKSRVWYVVDSDSFNKYQQKTIPDFVAITKDGNAKVYRTLDYEYEYSYPLDGQYRDQKKFVDLGTYAKMDTTQINQQIGISDQAQYQLNKLYLEDDSSNHSINAYQAPQFIKFNTKINHLGETVTVPNGLRPKIMNDASPNIVMDQDQIDFTFELGEPLKKVITIKHQKYIGYQSQDGKILYITKQLAGDSLAKYDQIK